MSQECFCGKQVPDYSKSRIIKNVCSPFSASHLAEDNNYYCVLHLPDENKHETTNFNDMLKLKIKQENCDFRGIYFPTLADFSSIKFKEAANFSLATFQKEAKFSLSEFERVCYFSATTFKSNIYLDSTVFNEYFVFYAYHEQLIEIDVFENEYLYLNLQFARIKNPEQVIFHGVNLHPNWFINVNSKNFIFSNVIWKNVDDVSAKDAIGKELALLNKREIRGDRKQLLKVACQQLAENAESNSRFTTASKFRQMAMETEWLIKKEKVSSWINNLVAENEKLKKRAGGSDKEEDKPSPPTNSFGILRRSGDFIIHGLYRITSFYGESWSWAAFVLAIIIFVIFPLIYTKTEFQISPPNIPLEVVIKDCSTVDEKLKPICKIENRGLNFWDEAIPHSLAIATLQTIEYRIPKTTWGNIWIILETIFAPLQAALLALAIRRKFMR